VIAGLDHVQLAAPPGCEEDAGASSAGCWASGSSGSRLLSPPGAAHGSRAARKAHPAFALESAAEVDALASRLAGAGVEVRFEEELPGYRRFYAADPWGNRLEFLAPAVRP
jgi:catechol 2,3-dioxygenase-like lactoylglutathione lyase family enzyme